MKAKLTYKLISEIGVKEKYIRKEHYNTIKVWWARRPTTAMRSILIREMLQREKDNSLLVDTKLISDINPPKSVFDNFSKEYQTQKYSVLDVFAGGGSIPFESARLGFNTFAAELNPVASLLQESIFNSQQIKDFPELFEKAGISVITRAEKRLAKYYTLNDIKPYVIFWSKAAKCSSCGGLLDLRRLQFLSKRPKKTICLKEVSGSLELVNTFSEQDEAKPFSCKKCNTEHSYSQIKDFCKKEKFNYIPFAYCYTGSGKGKHYNTVTTKDANILSDFNSSIDEDIKSLSHLIPEGAVQSKSGVINPTIYDLKKHADFFSNRQLLVLLVIIDELINEYKTLIQEHNENVSKQILLSLTCLIEFLVDWNSVSTMWISQNEQTGRSLAGPGVGMKWDFIEINPFSKNGSNLLSKLNRVATTFKAIHFNTSINIIKGSSTSLPLKESSIDIVLTDPPYYDSIDYTGLSEFFRPWFEVLIKNTFDNKINLKNQDEFEAIVELNKNQAKDHNHYQKIMSGVLSEVNRVLKDDGSALMLYSHKTIEGWEVIANAFKAANLFIIDIFPLEMERIARPRAMAYEALNGVIVFRAKKNNKEISTIEQDILTIKDKLQNGDILESQIVIYLAALACKEVSITGSSYKESYNSLIKRYQIILIEKWMKDKMDEITVAYLEGRLNGSITNLSTKLQKIITSNNLHETTKVKDLESLELGSDLSYTILSKAHTLYNSFKNNSKTKVSLDKDEKESITAFFSILAGTQLNTISKRSSNSEIKTSRLILSKII